MSIYKKVFGDPNKKELKKIEPIAAEINGLEEGISKLSNDELKLETGKLKEELKIGKTLDDILPRAFALVREASKRAINVRHYDVQLVGGIVLHKGQIAEMKTGEGKTHVAALSLYLNSLSGKGAHLITVNDYLARRDAGWNGAANHLLGVSTSCIIHEQAFIYDPEYNDENQEDLRLAHLRPISRKEAYDVDITYGTNNEFGFDYLRDNMVALPEQKVQRPFNYAIVDEVDSILIDEARTPLIISAPSEDSSEMYYQYAKLVENFKEDTTEKKKTVSPFYQAQEIDENDPNMGDYNKDEKMHSATFTDRGVENISKILGRDPWKENDIKTIFHLESALKAKALFTKDKDYIAKDGEVIIIDEFTGRMMPGRRYSEGIHQAIEAKEHIRGEDVEIKQESQTLATISFQNLFRIYKKLSGMTGTALTESEEFYKIYGLVVVAVPTNQPVVRQDKHDLIYKNESGKFQAIVDEVKRRHEKGQPVLIGTISIEKNEILSRLLEKNGVPHQLLNAKHHLKEAQIVSQAGKIGAVTLATNMAGRGVDIKLGGDPPQVKSQKSKVKSQNEVESQKLKVESKDDDEYSKYLEEQAKIKELGGLCIIGSERHEARRIDNQLRGRSGRQGDPGSSQFYVCMEDDLMRIFGSDRMKNVMEKLGVPDDMPIENKLISSSIESAQKKVEGHNFDTRKRLVEYDDVMNKHRETIYRKRNEVLEKSDKSKDIMLAMIESEIEQVVSFHTAVEDENSWNINEIYEVVHTIFSIDEKDRVEMKEIKLKAGDRAQDAQARTEIINYLVDLAKKAYQKLEQNIKEGGGDLRDIERGMALRTIDQFWVEHLDNMQHLRVGIGLQGYGQRDPLVEYKKEGYILFNELQNNIQRQIVYSIYKVGIVQRETASLLQRQNINLSAPEKVASKLSSMMKSMTQSIRSSNSGGSPMDDQGSAENDQPIISKKVRNESGEKVGRNDECPCGSGKKYKKCCGR
ncbi:MAG: preprotein translocase subunit SecA [bacterium]